jgi:hypothetical protein
MSRTYLRIPLWFGTLKVKHRERLRYEERWGQVPVWRFGRSLCVAWWPRGSERRAAGPAEAAGRDGETAGGEPPR